MRTQIAAVLTLGIASFGMAAPALGAEPYLYDLVKKQPYKTAYGALLKEMAEPPDYLQDVFKEKGDYLAFPAKPVSVGSWTYRIVVICPTNVTCSEYGSVFLFSADGRQAWGAVRDGDTPEVYLGNPSDAQKKTLDEELNN